MLPSWRKVGMSKETEGVFVWCCVLRIHHFITNEIHLRTNFPHKPLNRRDIPNTKKSVMFSSRRAPVLKISGRNRKSSKISDADDFFHGSLANLADLDSLSRSSERSCFTSTQNSVKSFAAWLLHSIALSSFSKYHTILMCLKGCGRISSVNSRFPRVLAGFSRWISNNRWNYIL